MHSYFFALLQIKVTNYQDATSMIWLHKKAYLQRRIQTEAESKNILPHYKILRVIMQNFIFNLYRWIKSKLLKGKMSKVKISMVLGEKVGK